MSSVWCRLPWQGYLWQQMVDRGRQDTLAHAYLLRGVPGVGKLQFARSFASYLLCLSPVDEQACGHCKECELLLAGTHPDIVIVEPDEPGRPIKIDRIRELNEFAHKTAQQGGRRVIIINPAEAMNVNASNALLKCLEEPGEDTLYLLISARAGDMLPTIRSRCQQLTFTCPDKDVALEWLQKELENPADAPDLLGMVAGAPLEAARFAREGVPETRRKLSEGVKALLKGQITPVELAKDWQGSDLPQVLAWLGSWLDDAIKLGLTADREGSETAEASLNLRNSDLSKMLGYIAGKTDVRIIVENRDWLLQQRQSLLGGGNLNAQLLMESVFCRILDLIL